MDKLIVNPISLAGEYLYNLPSIHVSFTFLHGEAAVENEYDKFDIVDTFNFKPSPGIYECSLHGKNATFFLWKSRHDLSGLLVYDHDTDFYGDAKRAYENKKEIL